MSRRDSDCTVWADLSVRDRIVCDDVKAATMLDSDQNLVRAALYHFAVFVLGHKAVDCDSFRLRVKQGGRIGRGKSAALAVKKPAALSSGADAGGAEP